MGRINPWGDLGQMWLVGRYGGLNHVCNISWLSVKGCGCGERVSLPSPIDLTRRPYNTGHTTVWPRNFKVTIIQCQITRKWYNIELCLQWPTNRTSYMTYRTAPFSMTLNNPYPRFQGHSVIYTEYLRNGTIYIVSVSFRMTLSDIEWLSKIFHDKKRRAVSVSLR